MARSTDDVPVGELRARPPRLPAGSCTPGAVAADMAG